METSDAQTPPLMRSTPIQSPTPSRARRRKVVFWIVVSLVALIAIGAGLGWFFRYRSNAAPPAAAQGAGDPRQRPVPVAVATAERADVPVGLGAIGTVTPLRTATIHARVNGQLARILFQEGQLVREGTLLAEVDPRPFEVLLAQVQGQYERDRALLANARIDLERYRVLLEQDSIARQQLDSQESLVRQYEGALRADQGQIDAARLQLAFTRITAPFAGRVGLRQIDAGNLVSTSDASGIAVVTQLQPITVVFSIPQDDLPTVLAHMQKSEPLEVEAWDRERRHQIGRGHLTAIDNVIDATTGTVKLKAQFANDTGTLFPNQFVNVQLHLAVQAGATVIPAAAVQRGTKGSFVYVVKNDQSVAQRPVTTGAPDGLRVVVTDGIVPGEQVVVDGVDRLRDGAKVMMAGAHPADKGDKGRPGGGRPKRDPAAPR